MRYSAESEDEVRDAVIHPATKVLIAMPLGRGRRVKYYDGATLWRCSLPLDHLCALLFLATSINYMDRQVIAILAPILQGKFGWNEEEGYGHIVFAFQLAYMIGLLGVGWFIDRFGLKVGYVLSIAVWSLAACATAVTTTLLGFVAARFVLGLGEAGIFPAATKTVGEWFPRRERSLATGLFNTGTSSGAIIAPLLVPWIAKTWNWEMAFIALGVSGFVWIALWLMFYQRPKSRVTFRRPTFRSSGRMMPRRYAFGC